MKSRKGAYILHLFSQRERVFETDVSSQNDDTEGGLRPNLTPDVNTMMLTVSPLTA